MKVERRHMLLYAVTDRSWLHGQSLVYAVEEVLAGGATMLQLREKHLEHRDFLAQAQELLPLCRKYHVPLIINDDVQVALESGADGVHVGQSDLPVSVARKLLGPGKIVGATAKTVAQALEAQSQGADYLGTGAIFPTQTKAAAIPTSVGTLSEVCRAVNIPVVAIGGLKQDNLSVLEGCPISGIAVVSAIMSSATPGIAARELAAMAKKLVELGRAKNA